MIVLAALSATLLVACGSSRDKLEFGKNYYTGQEKETQKAEAVEEGTEDTITEKVDLNGLYLIVKNDMTSEYMILEQLSTKTQYMYYYSLGTNFMDKYGQHATLTQFGPGRIVTIGEKNEEGKLSSMQVSDAVWEYEGVTRFKVDEERKVFKIADTNYAYDSDVAVLSGDAFLSVTDLTELDELRVIGIDRKIYSITVTTGHGTLALENTSLFEGSYIQIGTKIFAEITPNMQMDVEEGTYTVAVAKDGYGGSREITIEKGVTTTLNLDELKGEGPKYGNILFAIPVQGATLAIDGAPVDYTQPVSLQYGVHELLVQAPGYDTWSRKLYVNSAEATIVIDPAEEDDDEEEATSASSESESTSSESESTSSESESTSSESEWTDPDYLSTLTELITSLM